MNRDRDFDQTLTRWLDDGAELAPERYVWAALEEVDRTGQRGAWGALLEATVMKLKPAAPILGVAAVVLLAIAAYQFLGRNVGGPQTPTPTPIIISSEQLQEIILTDETLPIGWTIDSTTQVKGAVLAAGIRGPARTTVFNLNGYVAGNFAEHTLSGPTQDGVAATWAALFESTADAETALPIYLADMESDEGWGLGTPDRAELGDEGWVFTGESNAVFGPGGDEAVPARMYIWRTGNLLLAVFGAFDYDSAQLLSVAQAMDQRAR